MYGISWGGVLWYHKDMEKGNHNGFCNRGGLSMNQTLVIGSAVVDVIVRVEHLPKCGEDVHVSRQSRSLGGCAYLVSDVLRHFGAPYSLCTAVGSGMYGDFVYEQLQKRGVPVYVRKPEEENGCCYCLVEENGTGERSFIVDHGIEYTFQESYLQNIDTDTIDSVYVCGLEIEESTGWEIIRYLEKHPEYTVYFAPGPRILRIPKDRMEKLLSLGVILHLNEGESMAFTEKDTVEEAARAIFRKTESPVVITLGEKGSMAFDGKEIFFAPPVKTSVVDTIGAGDSHAGAVISARRFGLSWQEAITAANHVSAAVVAKEGGQLEDMDFAKVLESLPEELRKKIGK